MKFQKVSLTKQLTVIEVCIRNFIPEIHLRPRLAIGTTQFAALPSNCTKAGSRDHNKIERNKFKMNATTASSRWRESKDSRTRGMIFMLRPRHICTSNFASCWISLNCLVFVRPDDSIYMFGAPFESSASASIFNRGGGICAQGNHGGWVWLRHD
jgi:hypothetical protein